MKSLVLLTYIIFGFAGIIRGQQIIEIFDNTLKVMAMSEEVFYCGLAAGDKLIFNFNEEKGKEIKEVEIIEYPSNSKFMDFKTSIVENKELSIPKTGIYAFRFRNASLAGRICSVKVQRIPKNESTIDFNTTVLWRTIVDSTYTLEQERYLLRSDTNIIVLTDQIAKVHSQTNLTSDNVTILNFVLPENTIKWSYYIGVNQAGIDAYLKASNELVIKSAPLIAEFIGYDPVSALALGGLSYLSQIQGNDDIYYMFIDEPNLLLVRTTQVYNYIKQGTVVNDFGAMHKPLKGSHHLFLRNDNILQGVDVKVKLTAIQVNNTWSTRHIKKLNLVEKGEPYLSN